METSAVLTIVVSTVERKSAIQSLPGVVSLFTSPKILLPKIGRVNTQVSTSAIYRLE